MPTAQISIFLTARIIPLKAACALFASFPFSSTRFSSFGTKIRQSAPAEAVTADKKISPPLSAAASSPIRRNTVSAPETTITSTIPRPISRNPNILPWVFSSPSSRIAFSKFRKGSLVKICKLEDVDKIITDAALTSDMEAAIKEKGTELMIVRPPAERN